MCHAIFYFSTHKELLPLRPEFVPDLLYEESLDCVVNHFSVVGENRDFMADCGLTTLTPDMINTSKGEKIASVS